MVGTEADLGQGSVIQRAQGCSLLPSLRHSTSSHEVAQGYKDVKETSAIAKFKMEGTENTYFLAWTTTPWTLPSNVILSVNANETYVKAKYQDYYVIMAEALLDSVLGEGNYEVVESMKGGDLEYVKYEPCSISSPTARTSRATS